MNMTMVFGATLVCLLVAALALAVGLVRGRPLLGGGCRTRLVAGGLLPGCEACPSHGSEDGRVGTDERSGGSSDAQRA